MLSGSIPSKLNWKVSSSLNCILLILLNIGVSLTGLIVIDKVPSIEVWLSSSVTVNKIESLPW